MADIVVIGAGVIGLSSALCLQRAGHRVTIIARDVPVPFETADHAGTGNSAAQINYASLWAGAHLRFILPSNAQEEREHALALATYRHMDATVRQFPEAGVKFMKGQDHFEAPPKVYRELTQRKGEELGLEEFRIMRRDELPDDKVVMGCEYRAWCANPMVYCAFLLRQFCLLGGMIVKRELRKPEEVFDMNGFRNVKILVNASGVGFGDPATFPIRGQTCLVANTSPRPFTFTRQNADGTWTFCIPRPFGGGTIVGGTKEVGDWSTDPRPETRAELLRRCDAAFPELAAQGGKGFRVLRDIVGRRPAREGGMRLEREQIANGRHVVHAYGLGGRGYELSWGVAEGVKGLVGDIGGAPVGSKL